MYYTGRKINIFVYTHNSSNVSLKFLNRNLSLFRENIGGKKESSILEHKYSLLLYIYIYIKPSLFPLESITLSVLLASLSLHGFALNT